MKGWKTVIFNALALTQVPGSPLELLPPKYSMPTMVIGNFILRAITTTPVFKGEVK